MRDDDIGLFWEDEPRVPGERHARVMPDIPDTGWEPPAEFPNLRGAKALAVDVETKDEGINADAGPGWARGQGHLVGIAVGTPEGDRWYFPMRHTVEPETNMNPEHVLAWARDHLTDPGTSILGANITYDVGWLREEGVHLKGRLHDVQFAEALIREDANVALEALGQRYLDEGKESNQLYEWCDAYYTGGTTDQRKNIWRAPPRLVGPYAESDVDLPFRVFEKQWPILEKEKLLDVYEMECKLIYLMIEMRYRGVQIDLDRAEELQSTFEDKLADVNEAIAHMVGFPVNPDKASDMKRAFKHLGLQWGVTKKGNPSFKKAVLKKVKHPFVDLIGHKREYEKLLNTFIRGYILDSHVDSRLYCSFNQLRGRRYGARSGRFSSSNPNLQNIPSRTEEGQLIRTCFVPDEGHVGWRKIDYSQIEYRYLAHYASGPGSEEVRMQYKKDPNTDFHNLVRDIIKNVAHRELERTSVKNVNFGVAYGMGIAALASLLQLNTKEASELLDTIHKAAPFLRSTMDDHITVAENTGFITTIMGRRSRFDYWVPQRYDEAATPLPFDKAIRLYRSVRRAYVHKSLNRRLQGSAADLIKMAMLKCWEGGHFDEIGVPLLTVHDELDFSDPGGVDHVFADIVDVMENAIQCSVPIKADMEIGPSWGQVT